MQQTIATRDDIVGRDRPSFMAFGASPTGSRSRRPRHLSAQTKLGPWLGMPLSGFREGQSQEKCFQAFRIAGSGRARAGDRRVAAATAASETSGARAYCGSIDTANLG